jgi:predicted enzyme related to lactoylglutathione lyase
MANPVIHWEIVGQNAGKLQEYYAKVFGWEVKADNPMNYGLVDNKGAGINGGIGDAEGGPNRVTIYVAVPDLQAALDKAVENGGQVVVGVTEIPNMVTFALFSDPEGNVVGLVKDSM